MRDMFHQERNKGEMVCSEYGRGLYAVSQLYDCLTTFPFLILLLFLGGTR
jgi:hypothetical protein